MTEYWNALPQAASTGDESQSTNIRQSSASHFHPHSIESSSSQLQLDLPFVNIPPPLLLAINYLKRQIEDQSFIPTSVELRLPRHLCLLWHIWARMSPPSRDATSIIDIKPKFIDNDPFYHDFIPLALPSFEHLPNKHVRLRALRFQRHVRMTASHYESAFFSRDRSDNSHKYSRRPNFRILQLNEAEQCKQSSDDGILAASHESVNTRANRDGLQQMKKNEDQSVLLQISPSDLVNISETVHSLELSISVKLTLQKAIAHWTLYSLRQQGFPLQGCAPRHHTGLVFDMQTAWSMCRSLNQFTNVLELNRAANPETNQQILAVYS